MIVTETEKTLDRKRKSLSYVAGLQFAITENACPLIESEEFSQSIDLFKVIYNEGNKVVTTGMGKAGYIMQKFSSTLCSFGVHSCFLHPGEASHGDLGILNSNDLLFVASTSGKTREVLETIDLSRKLDIYGIIGLTSHKDSKIREKADIVLDMGGIEEAGELKLAPTTSTTIMSIVTDALALIVSEEIGLTKEQFGKLHHSGSLHDLAMGKVLPNIP